MHMQRNPADRKTVTVEEAARRLGIGRTLAYTLAAEGRLPGAIRLGRRYVVALPRLDEALGITSAVTPLYPPDTDPQAAA